MQKTKKNVKIALHFKKNTIIRTATHNRCKRQMFVYCLPTNSRWVRFELKTTCRKKVEKGCGHRFEMCILLVYSSFRLSSSRISPPKNGGTTCATPQRADLRLPLRVR